ncbi:hypothetical protein BJ165DRAFT_1567902 [Panaeolus papilionaceus]|nr:hypothetical protein BJ165DRAFT_1567902 [Panaeolus papilionaceus]
MIIYIIYNADLLEIPNSKDKDTIGYIDDTILITMTKDFTGTTMKLQDMMECRGGGNEWSRTHRTHNSRFKMSKVVVMHFSRKMEVDRQKKRPGWSLRETAPPLILQGTKIKVIEKAVGIPKLTYAVNVWYEPPNKTNMSGPIAVLREITATQKRAAQAITGTPKGVAEDKINAHANLLPVETLLQSISKHSFIQN